MGRADNAAIAIADQHWQTVRSQYRAHNTVFPKIMTLMKEKGMTDVLLTGGGIIPDKDIQNLNKLGVGKLFPPGTDTKEIIEYITNYVKEHRNF